MYVRIGLEPAIVSSLGKIGLRAHPASGPCRCRDRERSASTDGNASDPSRAGSALQYIGLQRISQRAWLAAKFCLAPGGLLQLVSHPPA